MRRATAIRAALVSVAALAAAGAPTAPSTAAGANVAKGWQLVRHAGVTVEVPASWEVVDLARHPDRCLRYDASAVYLGNQGPEASCPAHAVGRATTVRIVDADQAAAARSAGSLRGATPADPATRTLRARDGRTVQVSAAETTPATERIAASVSFADAVSQPTQPTQPTAAPAPTTATPTRAGMARPLPSAATSHDAFDTCDAPSTKEMAAWAATSTFTAAAIYLGGVNLACDQPNLTPTWVAEQLDAGWSILPLYVGRQAPCTSQDWAKVSAGSATSQGTAAARDAVAIAQRVGLDPGTPVYLDMEGYGPEPTCNAIVFRYIDGWTAELHRLGYLAGVYGSVLSPIDALVDHYPSSADPRPDDLWIAHWNQPRGVADALVPDTAWAGHRIYQYRGPHHETHGGVTMFIDTNFVHADVARRPAAASPPSAPAPFADWEGLVAQQQSDFGGSYGPLAARTAAVARLADGEVTPSAYVESQVGNGWYEPHVAPVARLYWAFFGRIPDVDGTTFWAERHRQGTRLATIAQSFATSTEFATKTGKLSDQRFVEHTYTSVLGRQPDPAGLWYWTARLGSKRSTRGQVMVQVSESPENVRTTAARVRAYLAYAGMLRRSPTPAQLDAAAAAPLADVIAVILHSTAYATRVR